MTTTTGGLGTTWRAAAQSMPTLPAAVFAGPLLLSVAIAGLLANHTTDLIDRAPGDGLATNRDLFDPAVNARVAHAIAAGGRDWTPWATYTHGTYRRHLTKAAQGVAAWQAGERP